MLDPAVLGEDEGAWGYLEEVCSRLPELGLVVCAERAKVAARVRELRLGVDDWITKPVHPEEALARVEAVSRWGRGGRIEVAESVSFGELEIRPDRFQAFFAGASLELTRREFELLQLLAGGEQVLERDAIYQRIWGYAMAHGDRSIDAILLDPDTLGTDFWECLERICREIPGLRVLVCGRRSDLASRLRGLRTGAEDWITKPVAVAEVLARVEASCRPQFVRRVLRPDQLRAGELTIRPEMLEVIAAGKRMDLTRREFELLHLLAVETDKVLERDAIYRRVWGYSMPRGDRSVDTYVGRLRIKLDRASPSWAYIHTHIGIGYRFEPRPVAEAAAPWRLAAGRAGRARAPR